MECKSRHRALLCLTTLLALVAVIYVYSIEDDDIMLPSAPLQQDSRHLYDLVIHRTNGTDRVSLVTEKEGHKKQAVVSEFGWIRHMPVPEANFPTDAKESEISAENMIILPSKANIHRRIAQLNFQSDEYGQSFLTSLPDLIEPLKGKHMVYLCDSATTCGGLGDRQRGILGVFLLALVTRRRFGVRMMSPCDFNNFFTPNKINWTVNDMLLKMPFADHINAKDKHHFKQEIIEGDFNDKHLEDIIFLRNNQDFSQALLKNPKYSKLLPNWVKKGSRAQSFNTVWNLLFKPTGVLKVKLDQMVTQFKTSSFTKLICAHVRIGRNPTMPGDQASVNSVQSVQKLWEFLHRYGNNVMYFIATDADAVRDMAKHEFGQNLLTVSGKIRHIDRQRNENDVCEGFETALLEQQILKTCDILVISQSGFSIFAAYLRKSNENLFKFDEGRITPFELQL